MKELSIEEKAKRYDEAIAMAKECITYIPDEAVNKYILNMFPELKKSENERIRGELINFVKSRLAGFPQCEKYIAWLETQGEQKSVWHNEDEEPQRGSLILLIMQSGTPIVAKIIEPNHTFNHGERWAYIDDLLEKQVDNADKVEPKFKVGDWVVYCGKTCKITGLHNGVFTITNQDGSYFFNQVESTTEPVFHLWTIQDAKDGDVLCYKDEISLYKHDIKNYTKQETIFGGFVYYCCCDGKRFIVDSIYSLIEQDKMNIHPATKEQRDLLFQKMKEVGYEWNTDKKELIKS